ncbi:hypothetical protein JY651_26695 [Pyxidicoccus parkwayensis]|uniref:Uncharacterized protein n=1 Tax=Pyxidicoccus parkwayensis TaxID=2813578 RepID=A0ABX7NKI7_9BACT|nr:hypothetical protein [Pyxidicoccus parkwaysis]QSQ18943.1 hypothetical protein JY651_26695 [Pyxidicoccus parkwaysis]
MRRPSDAPISDLKRILLRLSLLDGRLTWCVEGPRLIWLQHVHDPLVLLEEIERHGRPTLAGLQRAARMVRPPLAVDVQWLGAAQRDLKALRRHPSALTLISEARRVFRRHGLVDAAWLDARQHALDALSRQLSAGPMEGTAGVHALVEALHGSGTARVLERSELRSREQGRLRRAEGQRRIAALTARLSPDSRLAPCDACEIPDDVLEGFAREVLHADRVRGRPFERRLRRTVQAMMAWPAPPPVTEGDTPPEPLPPSLGDAVRVVGEEVIAAQRSTSDDQTLEQRGRALGVLGLMFRPDSEVLLTPSDVSLVLRNVERLRESLAGQRLGGAQVLELLRLERHRSDTSSDILRPLGGLVAQGLELSLVSELVRGKLTGGLVELMNDVEAARIWGQWALRLAPVLKKPARETAEMASTFRGITRSRKARLTLLGRCLLTLRSTPKPQTLLTWLDATLGLVRSAPEQARQLHADLMGTAPGLGRSLFPEFAAWLGEEALLDRYCHLRRLAGEPPGLPRTLLRDFARATRHERELVHLSSLEGLTEGQRRRLERLAQVRPHREAPPSPEWTLRRLRERVEAAQAQAFEVRLDVALDAVLRAGWGICLSVLTPAWRDAVRFHLSTEENKELLGTLLRHAAAHPGQPLVRAMPANTPWLKRAAKRMNVEAWLAPRSTEVRLEGRRYVLSLEQDPLQVLRMGIPFNTCLSIEGGGGSAATVLNALDANKRVLYLRDEAGNIVARKLLAVSRDWKLLGYRLYVALERELRPEVERAFLTFCEDLASSARLRLATSGEPEPLHPGRWYDDGTVPFHLSGAAGPAGDSVAAYCRHLGRPTPPSEGLEYEADVWFARQREDVGATLTALGRNLCGEVHLEAAHWLLERLGEAECLQLARHHPMLGFALLRRAFTPDAEAMLAMLGRFPRVDDAHWEAAEALLDLASPSAAAARMLVDVARRESKRSARFSDHGIEHGTLDVLPPLLSKLEVATALELCERVAPLWDSFGSAGAPYCGDCRDEAWRRVLASCARAYERRPDPAEVVRCLADARRHPATHRVALHLAARFPFPSNLERPGPVPRGLTWLEGAPIGCPPALRVLRRRCASSRELAALPDMLAALLRQSGPGAFLPPGALPVPGVAPFEALADLRLHLPGPTREVLARWDGAPAEKAVDLTPLRRALHALDVGTRPGVPVDGEGEALEPCFDVLTRGGLPLECWRGVLEQLVERRAPDALVARATNATFAEPMNFLPDDVEELLIRLAERPRTRQAVVGFLSRLHPLGWPGCHARLTLAARARGWDASALLDAVCAGWVRRFRGTESLYFEPWIPAGLVDALERAALAQGPLISLRLFAALPSHAHASRFLDRMLAELPRKALQEELAVSLPCEGSADPRRDWLKAVSNAAGEVVEPGWA